MHITSRVSLLLRWLIPISLLMPVAHSADGSGEPGPTPVAVPDSLQRIHTELQAMDRRLRSRLLRLSHMHSSDRSAAASQEEIGSFRARLRSLEARNLREGSSALVDKIRAMRPLIRNLERASEQPETAAAGLAGLRKALRVELPDRTTVNRAIPVNDDCADAIAIGSGAYFGSTSDATADGEGTYSGSPDVWYAFSSPVTVDIVADTFGSGFDTVLSVHTGCPGTAGNEIASNDDIFGLQSAVSFQAQAGERYLVRVAGCCGEGGANGPFTLNVGPGGVIAGTVIHELTGDPVVARQNVLNQQAYVLGSVLSDTQGSYQVPGLPTGTYFVDSDGGPYLAEIYDDIPCDSFESCGTLGGTPIAVTAGATTAGIDFAVNEGGRITGNVIESATGDPVSGFTTEVLLLNSGGSEVDYMFVAGGYSFSGLYAGSYYVLVQSSEYRDELYDDVACAGGCSLSAGTLIEVVAGATTGGINFALERLGTITGSVSDSMTGLPLPSVTIDIWDEGGAYVKDVWTTEAGAYEVGGLAAGSYFVTTRVFDYFDELYDNLPCEPECDPTTGTPIAVSLNSTTSDVDFVLERSGVVTGIVTRRLTGDPVSASVFIWDELGNEATYAFSDSTGYYRAEGLVPGSYTGSVLAYDHLGELYDGIPCPRGDCDPRTGMPFAVDLNNVTSGIDFALERLAAVSGNVSHQITDQPLRNVEVEIYDAAGSLLGSTSTDDLGFFIVRDLDPGSVRAIARDSRYAGELYSELPCIEGCDPAAGTPISTSLNTITGGVNFTLDSLGSISGQVTHGGQPVPDARVEIYDSSGAYRNSAYSFDDGGYIVTGLLPGTYFALVDHYALENELYDDIPCVDGCDPTLGTPLTVNLNATTVAINFDLELCTPNATRLCLTGDRFQVEATWEDFQNDTGPARAEGLTSDAGTFWFFDPGNIEMVVKVLDVCVEPHNRFWVFGAGLTDVGVELTVTDKITGQVRAYSNPLGTTYQPVLDTLAFATCDYGFGSASGGVAEPPASSLWQPLFQSASRATCVPSATSLCLNGGRFLAELIWEAPNGDGGPAPVVQLTDESGYFWFGSADNVEVVVKVLDACDLPPFNNYWVFAAGLTNFEVTLKVTDTETGEINEYFNPQGTTFQAVTDTGAFDTCSAAP